MYRRRSTVLACLVRIATVVFLFLPVTAPSVAAEEERPADEYWLGTLDMGVAKLRLQVDVRRADDGTQTATLISLDQGNVEIPLDSIAIKDNELRLEAKKIKSTFVGKLNSAGDLAKGTWTQFGRETPLTLRRVKELPKEEVKESWSGVINAAGQELMLQFRIMVGEDGMDYAVLDSLSQGAKGIAARREVEGDTVRFLVPVVKGKFEGVLDKSGLQIKGTWSQSGQDIELLLVRTDEPLTLADIKKPDRPQHPREPFPYESRAVTFRNDQAGVTLAGTLTVPKAKGRFPAVVLVTGSGPQDRDETLMDHKPFLVIADYLSRKGIAVLRFDDRGVGESTGDFAVGTTADFAEDARAALEFLSKNQQVDAERIGIIGHSEGGIIAGMLAATSDRLAHVVLLAGPGIPGDEIIISQSEAVSKLSGASESHLKSQTTLTRALMEALKVGADRTQLEGIVDQHLLSSLKDAESESEVTSREEMEEVGALIKKQLDTFLGPWFRAFVSYDPREDLRQVRCPVLALNGSKDLQVLVDLNLPAIERALGESSVEGHRCVRLEGLNHLFQTAESGMPTEYAAISETMSPQVLDLLDEWIKNH